MTIFISQNPFNLDVLDLSHWCNLPIDTKITSITHDDVLQKVAEYGLNSVIHLSVIADKDLCNLLSRMLNKRVIPCGVSTKGIVKPGDVVLITNGIICSDTTSINWLMVAPQDW